MKRIVLSLVAVAALAVTPPAEAGKTPPKPRTPKPPSAHRVEAQAIVDATAQRIELLDRVTVSEDVGTFCETVVTDGALDGLSAEQRRAVAETFFDLAAVQYLQASVAVLDRYAASLEQLRVSDPTVRAGVRALVYQARTLVAVGSGRPVDTCAALAAWKAGGWTGVRPTSGAPLHLLETAEWAASRVAIEKMAARMVQIGVPGPVVDALFGAG